ncbi:NUDIX domain-containing protein [Brucella intermedia]|uniref:NUDIX domain-containing protein n=1 Tax=Brucella intermedia TaxID=94625 RepID=UPI00396A2D54
MKHPREPVAGVIEKCAAVIVQDRRLLVVRKRGTSVYISPGGKIEQGETQWDCLQREFEKSLTLRLSPRGR